ncbi:hypothetical protein OIU84_024928 [Salix udensis]|uniref:Ankyrin repeat family protein n=1 Tax=Salix udensis TaxID=889485 RepID=A0AAD6PD23_9ROSI|nr:hypothetical protein OIU84_024928 [Salix udensis]
MPPAYFPLRWESTGDQWWFASPIDWAAANGHFDLVRELLRIDNNHLINLTSLRRIRRLESVWDDEEQFDDVAKCRSQVARKLFHECEFKKGKNSLIQAGYGGWLMYTAASAGDLSFVQELLERNPLLVFGEGEYGVTDTFYAAARSKNARVFRLIYDFAISPRFLTAKGEFEEHIGEIPSLYKWEMMNRAIHAAARGGNLTVLKELLSDCTDVLSYRDKQGATILHAAAARGQVEVVKDLIASFEIINSTDNLGNTALHIAAYRGQSSVVEALIVASPLLTSSINIAGETFLHMAVSGFQNPAFRRLDRQIELMKQLMSDGMTPLDLLRQRPHSASSDILMRQLISAGGIFGCQDYTTRRAIASRLKMQGNGGSPGSSFRISDNEIFLYTGIEIASDAYADPATAGVSPSSSELSHPDQTNDNHGSTLHKRRDSFSYAAQQLKRVLQWPRLKDKKPEKLRKSIDQGSVASGKKCSGSEETPTPLRQRFSNASSIPNNKRTLSVRSNQSSPTAKKKLASGIMHGVVQGLPQVTIPGRSRSSSFSKSSISSPGSLDKQKGVFVESDVAGPSTSNRLFDDGTPKVKEKEGLTSKKSRSQYFCFGAAGLSVKTPVSRHRNQGSNPSVISVA